MVDLAEPGAAILVLGEIAVVLDAETPDVRGAGAKVRDRVNVQVVHHVAGVVIDLDPFVVHLADDRGAGGAGAGLAAVLLDHDRHTVVPRHRPELLEPLDPELAVAAPGMTEREHVPQRAGRRLADPRSEHRHGIGCLGIDHREHQQRLEAEVAALAGQLPGPFRRGIGGHHRHFPCPLPVRRAPGDIPVPRRLDARERPIQREPRVRQRHARDLESRRLPPPG